MHTHRPVSMYTLQPVTDHDCEQITGGLDYGALISVGVEVLEIVMTCAVFSMVTGVPCFA